jgi:hypothetical protein
MKGSTFSSSGFMTNTLLVVMITCGTCRHAWLVPVYAEAIMACCSDTCLL